VLLGRQGDGVRPISSQQTTYYLIVFNESIDESAPSIPETCAGEGGRGGGTILRFRRLGRAAHKLWRVANQGRIRKRLKRMKSIKI